MTAKRFRVVHSTVTQKFVVVDNEHEEIFEGIKNRDNACRFSNLLNALYEENRELQRHLDVMRSGALTDDKRIKELYNENEQLKAQLKCYEKE